MKYYAVVDGVISGNTRFDLCSASLLTNNNQSQNIVFGNGFVEENRCFGRSRCLLHSALKITARSSS